MNPDNPTSGPAMDKYTYAVSNTAPSVITEQTEELGGGYITTETIPDSLGRTRESQTQTASGSTGTVTGTRYYTLNGITVAARTGATGLAFLAGDQQDTSSVAIDSATLGITRRHYDPYGNPRGTVPSGFPAGAERLRRRHCRCRYQPDRSRCPPVPARHRIVHLP